MYFTNYFLYKSRVQVFNLFSRASSVLNSIIYSIGIPELSRFGARLRILNLISRLCYLCYKSHCTMIYKNGERMCDFLGFFVSYRSLVFYILGTFLIKQLFHSRLLDMRRLYTRLVGYLSSHIQRALME